MVRTLPVGALCVATALAAWHQQGSIAAHDWLPLAVLAALVTGTVAAAGAAVRPQRAILVGSAGLVVLAGWTAVSISWSPSPAGARDEALLVALYALVLLLPTLSLAGRGQAQVALSMAVAVLGVLGVATALKLGLSANPEALLFGGRLAFPISYVNACSALFALGFWPAAILASEAEARPIARAGAVGAAAVFLALAVAAQSKGTLVGLVGSTVLVFAFVPRRLRVLVPTLLAVASAAAFFLPLTAPYRSAGSAAARGVGVATLAVLAAAAVAGYLYALVDRRVAVGEAGRRFAGRAVLGLVLAAVVTGLSVFMVDVRHPGAWAAHEWTAFKTLHSGSGASTHLTALGSNRYDFWRVALDDAAAHPLQGIGGRGFYSSYLLHRRSSETPLRAHSLYLDVLAEEGVPGLMLLLVGVGAPLALLARRLRRPAAAAAFGAGTYFSIHAAVDWIWTVPAVGVIAFLLMGIGCAGESPPPLPRRVRIAVAPVAVALGLLVFGAPWLAYRYVTAAYGSPRPAADLAWARRLDPLSLEPYWAAWRLAATPAERVAALRSAQRVEPSSVAVLYQLGLAYAEAGRRADAHTTLVRAAKLDPRDRTIRRALAASP